MSTTAIVAILAYSQLARAEDIVSIERRVYPRSFISVEAGSVFDASQPNLSFSPNDAWLADLSPLRPGRRGGYFRYQFGQQIDNGGDIRTSLSHFDLSNDTTQGEQANAKQNTRLNVVDAEIGYNLADGGVLHSRLFGGGRILTSLTQSEWSIDDKVGTHGHFDDRVFAIGPRVGLDLTLPLKDSEIASAMGQTTTLVGSASGSLLFGHIDTQSTLNSSLSDHIDRTRIWNVEGMAGAAFEINKTSKLTIGYRAAKFGGMSEHSDVDKSGDFENGKSDLLVHGPFARMTVDIP